MKLFFFIVISFIIGSSFFYKTYETPIRIFFSEKIAHVEVDGFGNIYIIQNDQIIKYNAIGVLQKKFSVKRYGKIDFVDATNPLKILVYYKDFQQIVFLDNQLTASSNAISLETIGYEQTSLVCSSANNSFWIFDKQNNELSRFNAELKSLVKTGNLKRILDVDIKPNFMLEHNNYVYLNCPNEGILVFDIYGTFYKTIPLKNLKEFNVVNGDVFFFENHKLKQYQSQTFNTIQKQFSDTIMVDAFWRNNKIYKVYADSLVSE